MSSLIGFPGHNPFLLVVTRWRCPGLVGLYFFSAGSARAAKPRGHRAAPAPGAALTTGAGGRAPTPDAAHPRDSSGASRREGVARLERWRPQEPHTG